MRQDLRNEMRVAASDISTLTPQLTLPWKCQTSDYEMRQF